MTPSAASPSSSLLNASVLVFFFRALAGARTPDRRLQVAGQLLGLLEDFVPFASGRVMVGNDLEPAFREAAKELGGDPSALWRHLTSEDTTDPGF